MFQRITFYLLNLLAVACGLVDLQGRNPVVVLRLRGAGRAFRERVAQNALLRRQFWSAAASGDNKVVRKFLKDGIDPNSVDHDGWTACHWAAVKGHTQTLKILHEGGADVSAKDKFKSTPLHWAAKHGHRAAIEALCEMKSNIHARDADACTPIGVAAKNQQEWACEFLKRKLAELWQRVPPMQKEGWMARLRKDRIDEQELDRLLGAIKRRRRAPIGLGKIFHTTKMLV